MDRVICVIVCLVAIAVSLNVIAYCASPDAEATAQLTVAETAPTVEATTVTEAPTAPEPTTVETTPPYTEDELEMMALVIYQEAGGNACSDETRLMVGNVVMNRVTDSRFPDTIYDVLTRRGQYGLLHWTGLVWPAKANDPTEAHAVERAYACAERVLLGEKLLPDDVVWQAEFIQGTEVVAYQDGMYFCR
jgi:hypothetical protein